MEVAGTIDLIIWQSGLFCSPLLLGNPGLSQNAAKKGNTNLSPVWVGDSQHQNKLSH
jgi:hypothetical protein